MDFYELLLLLLVFAGIWYWLDSLKAREIGMAAARQACHEEGLQFLDETVVGRNLGVARNEAGSLQLRRRYEFEYSDNGDNRRAGSVTMLGHDVEIFHLRPNLYVVPHSRETHD